MTLMPHVLILLRVDHYPAWKAVFDGAADLRWRPAGSDRLRGLGRQRR
jgi:hypothetical protein